VSKSLYMPMVWLRMTEWIWATHGDYLGMSVSGYGVLALRSGGFLGI